MFNKDPLLKTRPWLFESWVGYRERLGGAGYPTSEEGANGMFGLKDPPYEGGGG